MAQAVVALAKRASDASVECPELDKSATLLRNSSREINRSHPTTTYTEHPSHDGLSSPHPQVLSLQPGFPQEDDMTAQWLQATGYVQPIEGVNSDFDSLDALIAWEQGGGVPEPTPTLPLRHNLVSICILTSKPVTYVYHRVSIGPQS